MAKQKQEIPSEQEVNLNWSDEESLSPDEAQSRIALMLARTQNLETLSETDIDEVKLISALSTISRRYKLNMIQDYVANYLKLKVSLHRQGRKEIQEIAKPSAGGEERAKSGLRNLLLGGRA